MKSCTQCGRCCTNADFMQRIGICDEDEARWRREGRSDILAEVNGEMGWRCDGPCPFIRPAAGGRLTCAIYDTRPATCREFPLATPQMRYVDCDMLDEGDTDADVARFMGR